MTLRAFSSRIPLRSTLGLLLAVLVSLAPASTRTGQAAGQWQEPPPPELESLPVAWPGQTLRFEHIGIEDGLSQSTVTSILQDRKGFLWFGTEDGLNRYDGYSFTVFKPDASDPTSLSDRWIQTLYEDRHGNIWVGTRLGGLNRFNPNNGQFTRYQHDPDDPDSLSSNKVNAIFEDAAGIIWVGTEAGLDWLEPSTGYITHIRGDPSDPFTGSM
jgi:ligand-binding sensor domain-containing protein